MEEISGESREKYGIDQKKGTSCSSKIVNALSRLYGRSVWVTILSQKNSKKIFCATWIKGDVSTAQPAIDLLAR